MNVNPMLVRAVRGPIILITIGVLFAIDHAGGLQFERTWPALIIVIGLMKLFERAVGPDYQAAGYPQGTAWNPQYPGAYGTGSYQGSGYQTPPPPPAQAPSGPPNPEEGGPRS